MKSLHTIAAVSAFLAIVGASINSPAASAALVKPLSEPGPTAAGAPASALPASASAASSASSAPELNAQDVGAWLDGLMPTALHTARTPGAVVVIVKDGKVLLERGYGLADVKAGIPVDPKVTLFRPGSTSKLFTWTAVMQLVEQGKIDLDVDVNRYLDFKVPPRDGQPITMREIMTHRTGFEERIKDLVAFDVPEPALVDVLTSNMPVRIVPAATTSAYSNYATGIAGHIVERVSGMPYDDYIERNVFGPLAMKNSTFRQPLPEALKPHMAVGYVDIDTPPKGFEVVNLPPAGSLSTTGDDMAHFMIAHLNDGRYGDVQILRPETARMMHDTVTRAFPDLNGIALGFYQQNINGHRVIAHGGDLNYFHTDLSLFLDDHVGIFVSVNAVGKDGQGEAIRDNLFHAFADRYYPHVDVIQRLDAATAKADAKLIAGRYETTRRAETTFVSLINMLAPTVIEANEDGTISTKLGIDPETFTEIRPFLWHQVGGHDLLQAKVVDGRVAIWSTDALAFAFAFQPLHGLAGAGLELPLVCIALFIMLIGVLTLPVGAGIRKWHGVVQTKTGRARSAKRWGAAGAGATLIATVAWAALFSVVAQTSQAHLDGWIHAVQFLSVIGFIGGWLTTAWNLLVVLRTGGRRGSGTWAVLLFLASSLLLWVAFNYHLIGTSAGY